MTPDEIKEWLKATNRTRDTIAAELGYSKRTVDNWFTSGDIPLPAILHIKRIKMGEDGGAKLRFSIDEWDQIEAARKLAGYEDRSQFMVAALTSFASGLTKTPASYLSIVPADPSKVAEDPIEAAPPSPPKPRKKH